MFLLAASLVLAILWPRGPELVPYVSPPLDASGARLHMLVPRGWEANSFGWTAFSDDSMWQVLFVPCNPLSSLPQWLRRRLPVHAEAGASLSLIASRRDPRQADADDSHGYSVTVFLSAPVPGRRVYEQHRTVKRGGIEAHLDYYRTDRSGYDRTQTAIAHSMSIRP